MKGEQVSITTIKYISTNLNIKDSRYYRIADTSCGHKQTFLLKKKIIIKLIVLKK